MGGSNVIKLLFGPLLGYACKRVLHCCNLSLPDPLCARQPAKQGKQETRPHDANHDLCDAWLGCGVCEFLPSCKCRIV